jgi:hypothetical protein
VPSVTRAEVDRDPGEALDQPAESADVDFADGAAFEHSEHEREGTGGR